MSGHHHVDPLRRRPKDWELPEHRPIERSRERIDAGFVLIGGWQTKYEPGPDHRRWILSKECRRQLAFDATKRQLVRRRADERRQRGEV